MNCRKPVRTRNAALTRAAILRSAHASFVSAGYDHVGLRPIAADAGIDPALICRYFGSKEQLFAEVLASVTSDPMDVLAGDRATFGRRVASAVLDPAERSPDRLAFIELVARSGNSPIASGIVRRHIESKFIEPLSAWLDERHAADKAWLMACVLLGVVTMVGIECARPAAGDIDAATRRLGALLQRIVDNP